ncbi:MAG: hypothetical protein JWO36_4032 [Myxococcales bacterium]|nr:hypothetical protein [Myxococcales bacterium]
MRSLLLVLATGCASGTTQAPSGACKEPLQFGNIVLTEVFAAGTSGGPVWFEIYNAADRPVDLAGLTLGHSRIDGSAPMSHAMPPLAIAPGQYLTLGNMAAPYVDYVYGSGLGDLDSPDGGTLSLHCGATEIDTATYDLIKPGHSRELGNAKPPDALFNDDPANWCESDASEIVAGNFGTPGQDNDCTPALVGQCNNGIALRDAVVPQVGDLVITEIMANPSKVSAAVGQWFEIKVLRDVDLNSLAIGRAGSVPDVIASPDCIHVTAGSYVVFARTQDAAMNGGVPPGFVLGTFSFALAGELELAVGATVLDAVSWTRSTSGRSLQLDPSLTDPIANDLEANFCDSTMAYGAGDFGSPGAQNATCTSQPSPGMCDDAGTMRAIAKPVAGKLVITEVMPNPAGDETKREWFEITNIGTTPFDLNELGRDRDNDTRAPDVIHAASCKRLAPGAFALFARSTDPVVNAMLPAVDATFGFTMVNSGGNVEVLDGTTVLDRVTWTTTADGISRQLAPAHMTTTDNDVLASFCAGTTPFGDGTNAGTPKAANAPCP